MLRHNHTVRAISETMAYTISVGIVLDVPMAYTISVGIVLDVLV